MSVLRDHWPGSVLPSQSRWISIPGFRLPGFDGQMDQGPSDEIRGFETDNGGEKMKMLTKAILAAACTAGLAVAAPPALAQTTLRVVMHSDLKILDPIWTTAYIVRNHGYMIYDTLLAQDEKGASSRRWSRSTKTSADKKTYTFTLREGLSWHDGKPVTSEDCIASIKRWAVKDFARSENDVLRRLDRCGRCQVFHHQAQGTDRSRRTRPVKALVERAVHDAQAGRRHGPQQADRGFYGLGPLRLRQG